MSRALSLRVLVLGLLLSLAGCLRLDNFVFGSNSVPDDEDMLAASVVPADLREEAKGPIVSADGTVVDAYLLKHRPGDGTPEARHTIALLYAHGQGNNNKTNVPRLDFLWQMGFTVLGYDARGYGKTKGTPTEEGHYADARAARAWLESRSDLGLSPDRVGIYGRSLGSFWATKLAAERPPRALALESPVLSIQQIIDDSVSLDTPQDWYVDSHMDNARELPKFTGALLVMHGDADDYVQPAYGKKLHDLAEGHAFPNLFWSVPGADHSDVPCVSHDEPPVDNGCAGGVSEAYTQHVTSFFDAAFGVGP